MRAGFRLAWESRVASRKGEGWKKRAGFRGAGREGEAVHRAGLGSPQRPEVAVNARGFTPVQM